MVTHCAWYIANFTILKAKLNRVPHFTQAHCDVVISSSLPLPTSQPQLVFILDMSKWISTILTTHSSFDC